MRLATVRIDGGTRAGLVEGDQVTLLPERDVGALLAARPRWREEVGTTEGETMPWDGAEVAPLVLQPEKIICVGLNYRSHAEEANLPIPEYPMLFDKFWRSLIGARDSLLLPTNSEMVDWEAELGVVIGEPLRHADPDQARTAIAGYTIINDVSMRDWQRRTSQFLQGKTFERSSPIGPVLITPDELDDPDAMDISCFVDDVPMQEARTDDLIFAPVDLISYISQFVTLVPGDIIATGTPGGVGGARKPPVYLRPGQVLRTAIAGLGEQINHCTQEVPS
jgi:acylpyruvate hydrolase